MLIAHDVISASMGLEGCGFPCDRWQLYFTSKTLVAI